MKLLIAEKLAKQWLQDNKHSWDDREPSYDVVENAFIAGWTAALEEAVNIIADNPHEAPSWLIDCLNQRNQQ